MHFLSSIVYYQIDLTVIVNSTITVHLAPVHYLQLHSFILEENTIYHQEFVLAKSSITREPILTFISWPQMCVHLTLSKLLAHVFLNETSSLIPLPTNSILAGNKVHCHLISVRLLLRLSSFTSLADTTYNPSL